MRNRIAVVRIVLALNLLTLIAMPRPATAQGSGASTVGGAPIDPNPSLLKDQVPCLLGVNQPWQFRNLPVPPVRISGQQASSALTASANAISATDSDPNKRATRAAFLTLSETLSTSDYATATVGKVQSDLPGLINKQVSDAVTAQNKNAEKGAPTASTDTVTKAVTAAATSAVNSAAGTSVFLPPNDVACSMSMMNWEEERKAFGRTVADTFIAAEMTVRNMNDDYEFLVHTAELAVDANGAQLARFQVGHEKELVRSVLQYGQSYDRQHEFINIVNGVGTILGAVVGLPQPGLPALTGASGAYHAGFMPLFQSLFPDLTSKNLNTLNDLGFSAANSSRIVVPKGGSVPFVVFIPVQPLEQACWLQPNYNLYKDNDLAAPCAQVCNPGSKSAGSASNSGNPPPNPDNADTKNDCESDQLTPVRFRDWKPIQMQALVFHAWGLITGKHFKEINSQPTLKAITCAAPQDKSQAYLINPASPSALNCTLTGADLDTMTTLRLRSSADAAKTNFDAKSTVNGDSTTATASFAANDVGKLQQLSYELYSVDKTGTESDLKHAISFRFLPTITANQTIPAVPAAAAATFSLTGTNLQNVQQILFFDSTDTTQIASVKVNTPIAASGTTITAPVPTPPLKAATDYKIQLVLDDSTPIDTKVSVHQN